MLSLNNRPLNVSNGTLLVSLSDGRIQVWSHHKNAECNITDFNAIHVAGDVSKWLIDVHFYFSLTSIFHSLLSYIKFLSSLMKCATTNDDKKKKQFLCFYFPLFCIQMRPVTAMTTDTRNCYLFTGTSHGYIKVWMIVNFWYVSLILF